ncbi:hypothetical protein [Bifidobacterium olomucense]|uniref:Uncharacterized protein n=1 Tax=Bifidobacterium olomucense TaxID=2675324 RepID=A0A7Y0HVT7_9BIFI|nr:hypothetical protein [Bifidobacterium sp. DSM 109959]NMM97546.1 hypothetical protein [Bifidobacterium sp. DSM 109959]
MKDDEATRVVRDYLKNIPDHPRHVSSAPSIKRFIITPMRPFFGPIHTRHWYRAGLRTAGLLDIMSSVGMLIDS